MSIAPKEFTGFSDRHLEVLIRHILKKYPTLLKNRQYQELNPKFTVLDKEIRVPKFNVEKTLSLKKAEKEHQLKNAPGPTTYE